LPQGERKIGRLRRWSKGLTIRQRILAVNIFAIAILFGSIFYLDSFRTRLTQARIEQAQSEAVMIAHMMAAIPPAQRLTRFEAWAYVSRRPPSDSSTSWRRPLILASRSMIVPRV